MTVETSGEVRLGRTDYTFTASGTASIDEDDITNADNDPLEGTVVIDFLFEPDTWFFFPRPFTIPIMVPFAALVGPIEGCDALPSTAPISLDFLGPFAEALGCEMVMAEANLPGTTSGSGSCELELDLIPSLDFFNGSVNFTIDASAELTVA